MQRLTDKDPCWFGEEPLISAEDPGDDVTDKVYERLKEYEDTGLSPKEVEWIAQSCSADWVWFEEWSRGTLVDPPELEDCGWRCSNCDVNLRAYLEETTGERFIYLDDQDKKPRIKHCPRCGAKMEDWFVE